MGGSVKIAFQYCNFMQGASALIIQCCPYHPQGRYTIVFIEQGKTTLGAAGLGVLVLQENISIAHDQVSKPVVVP